MGVTARVGVPGPVGATGGLDPFLFRLDPTVVTQFGTPRSASANVPTIVARTDSDARPFVRMNSPVDSAAKMFPLLDDDAAMIRASGRYRIEMLTRPSSVYGMVCGIGFNVDRIGNATTCFAVCNTNALTVGEIDSVVSGVEEGARVGSDLSNDPAFEWSRIAVDVWLDLTTSRCTYTYGGLFGAASISSAFGIQQRKTSLQTAGGDALALYVSGGVGDFDIAELTIWKNERSW
jgi:hypothetical protein